jgi:hypothetical protein
MMPSNLIYKFIEKYICPGATIVSDCWAAYIDSRIDKMLRYKNSRFSNGWAIIKRVKR